MKVLISVAGIAGNALAFWLSKLGHDVTVVERFSSLRVQGLQGKTYYGSLPSSYTALELF